MERYSALSQANHSWMDDMSQTVTKMPAIENGIQAKIQMENATVTRRSTQPRVSVQLNRKLLQLQKLYNGAVTQKASVEDANVLGARLMREAKVSAIFDWLLVTIQLSYEIVIWKLWSNEPHQQ